MPYLAWKSRGFASDRSTLHQKHASLELEISSIMSLTMIRLLQFVALFSTVLAVDWAAPPIAWSKVDTSIQPPVVPSGIQTLPQSGDRLAQATPILEVNGVLEPGDPTLSDGSLYDDYTFEGRAGQSVTITLESSDFNTYLLLLNAQGQKIGESGNRNEGNLNSSLTINLPSDGIYRVIANAFDADGRGQYTLKVVPTETP